MVATTPAACRLVLTDRGFHRFGLANTLKDAGFRIKESHREMEGLRDLGLLEMDVLLEIDLGQCPIADFIPHALHMKDWKTFVCVQGLHDQPTLVLARKEGQDPSKAQDADLEVVTMLQQTWQRRELAIFGPASPAPASFVPPALRDTLSDVVLPLPPSPVQGTLNRLAGEVVHDLNNLMTVVRGNCQLLALSVLPKMAQDLIQEINKAGEHAALLADQLGAASRSEELPSQVQDLHELLASSAGMLRSLLGGRHELVLRLEPHPCPVRLVPGQLERVLVNLVANARDAMPLAGTLTISTDLLDLAPSPALQRTTVSGPHVRLTVTDTGTGLEERVRRRLFQPSSYTGGRGLGLPIVANLVYQHQGRIEVQSQPGRGTSFQIFLPVAASKDAAMMSTQALADGPETVMLVEDEPMVRSIFRRILQDNGFVVVEAANGPEALFLAQQFSAGIHLLVTDLSMPQMNGVELAEHMASLHPETKVLFLSGYSEGILPGQPVPDKNIAFLQKPFKADALVEKIREVLHGKE